MVKKISDKIFLGPCPVCHKKLKNKYIEILDKLDGSVLYCVECAFCLSSLLLNISSENQNLTTAVGILTDISKKDIAVIKNREVVQYDDVLTMHSFLEQE